MVMPEVKDIPDVLVNGVTFDEDSGVCLGTLTENDDGDIPMQIVPANISIYLNGFWYVYKMDSKIDAKETNGVQETDKV